MVQPGNLTVMNLRHCLLAALMATIWGFNFVVIDWGMAGIPPLLFVALRFVVVVVPAVFFVRRPDVPWRTLAGVGIFLSLGQFGLLYTAMAMGMPAGLAALVLQAQVIFTVVIAAGWLRERPTGRQAAGIGLATVGLMVVAFGRGGHLPVVALIVCLLAALSWGVGNVLARASGASGGLGLTVWSSTVVPVPLFALALVVNGPAAVGRGLADFGGRAALSTLYTAGLASLVGYAIFTRLLSRYPTSAVVPWVLLAPVVAMATAWPLLGERLTAAEAVGGAVMLMGVLVTAVRARSNRHRAPSVPALPLEPLATADQIRADAVRG